jgi:hypothetical protein
VCVCIAKRKGTFLCTATTTAVWMIIPHTPFCRASCSAGRGSSRRWHRYAMFGTPNLTPNSSSQPSRECPPLAQMPQKLSCWELSLDRHHTEDLFRYCDHWGAAQDGTFGACERLLAKGGANRELGLGRAAQMSLSVVPSPATRAARKFFLWYRPGRCQCRST